MEDQSTFRVGLKFYRKNLGVSQSKLASVAGLSLATIGNFEAGISNLSENSKERIRRALLELLRDRATALGFSPAGLRSATLSLSGEMQAGV
jgi:transcriptional regulator with XRE-family HTH domain